ncbi:MAG: cytochrome c [Acidobacteria bacterium]|nr:cytochrome c [Acidobacteriota bacterium]MCW5947942.1 cytochrome c [Pyrinomonadaceae bacterium]
MRTHYIKTIAAGAFALAAFLITFGTTGSVSRAAAPGEDPAVTYKAKCAMCHTAKAEKFFDPARSDEEHAQIILKGKKTEKPPSMPAYEEKGISAEDAKALAEYMRSIRSAGN